ncbi:MAG: peptidase M23 [Bacteroidota bacterium]
MKKSILAWAACGLVLAAYLSGCNSPTQKVENAQENVVKANQDLDQANKEYLADMDAYRKETAVTIATNEESLKEFKARIAHDKAAVRADYDKKIADLEKKNSDMKKKLDDYKADGKENWMKFKEGFNQSMKEMGQAFKDLTAKRSK